MCLWNYSAEPPEPGEARTVSPWGVLTVAVVALVLFHYRLRADTLGVAADGGLQAMTGPTLGFLAHNLAALAVLGLAPLAAARWLGGCRPRTLGLGAGRVRPGLAWAAAGVPVAILAGRLAAGDPLMRAVYPLEAGLRPEAAPFLLHVAGQLAYYVGWELLFRGVLLLGLERRLGFAGANTVQTALSVVAHFGRPLPETLSAIPAGLAFGGIVGQTRSIWPVVVIHLAVGAALDWFIVAG